jgi:hypothetical protein
MITVWPETNVFTWKTFVVGILERRRVSPVSHNSPFTSTDTELSMTGSRLSLQTKLGSSLLGGDETVLHRLPLG